MSQESRKHERCPRCDKVASRLEHQRPDGGREAYTTPTGIALYRCLTDGYFEVDTSGQRPTLKRDVIRGIMPTASTLLDALVEWRFDPRKTAPLVVALEASRNFAALAEDAIVGEGKP